jgi:hypothetical protein
VRIEEDEVDRVLEIQVVASLAFLVLGMAVLSYPIRFFKDADREWTFIERWRRRGGQPSLRTPEWEQARKPWHMAYVLLGLPLVVGGLFFLGDAAVATAQGSARFADFDELAVTRCSLDVLEVQNRGDTSRWVEVGPLRAMRAIPDREWDGRPVAISLDALGHGVIPAQVDVAVRGASGMLLAPGKRHAFSLSAGAGSCKPMGSTVGSRDCEDLVFRLVSAAAEGASADLDVLRFCRLD